MNFREASTPNRQGDSWSWDVPTGWDNGRTTFGGLQQAAMIRAMQEHVQGDQPLRTLSAVLCAALTPGPAELQVQTLRRGSNTTAVSVSIVQNDDVITHGFGLFGAHRVPDGDWQRLDPLEAPDWRSIPVADIPPALAPGFFPNWAFRPISGFPYSGAELAASSGWSMAREPGGPWDAAHVMAVADSYWPAPLATLTEFRPFATITTQTEFLADPTTLDADEPLFSRATSPAAAGGYTVEFREILSPDGRIVAMNQQSFAIIK